MRIKNKEIVPSQSMANVCQLMNNKAPFLFEVELLTISDIDIKHALKTISSVLFPNLDSRKHLLFCSCEANHLH